MKTAWKHLFKLIWGTACVLRWIRFLAETEVRAVVYARNIILLVSALGGFSSPVAKAGDFLLLLSGILPDPAQLLLPFPSRISEAIVWLYDFVLLLWLPPAACLMAPLLRGLGRLIRSFRIAIRARTSRPVQSRSPQEHILLCDIPRPRVHNGYNGYDSAIVRDLGAERDIVLNNEATIRAVLHGCISEAQPEILNTRTKKRTKIPSHTPGASGGKDEGPAIVRADGLEHRCEILRSRI